MFVQYPVDETEYDECILCETDWMDDVQDTYPSPESYELADNIFSLFQEIIDSEDAYLAEHFISAPCAADHFKKHCIGKNTHIKSTSTNVRYDFTALQEYTDYEESVCAQTTEGSNRIYVKDLAETDVLMQALRELFYGGKTVVFGLSCGFTNTHGQVRICLRSWASDVTTNYLRNTIDFLIQAPDGKTVTLFPLDAYHVEWKILHEIYKVSGFKNIQLKINH